MYKDFGYQTLRTYFHKHSMSPHLHIFNYKETIMYYTVWKHKKQGTGKANPSQNFQRTFGMSTQFCVRNYNNQIKKANYKVSQRKFTIILNNVTNWVWSCEVLLILCKVLNILSWGQLASCRLETFICWNNIIGKTAQVFHFTL